MGSFRSILSGQSGRLGYSCSSTPLVFCRPLDYNVAGNAKKCIQTSWELAMQTMVTVDLITRKLLASVIETRMEAIAADTKYQQEVVTLPKNSPIDESKVFEYHDIFQLFEIEPDGRINTGDLVVELDYLSEDKDLGSLMEIFSMFGDSQGRMSFQEFLELIQYVNKPENASHPIKQTFTSIQEINRYIRQMSVTQQVLCGLL